MIDFIIIYLKHRLRSWISKAFIQSSKSKYIEKDYTKTWPAGNNTVIWHRSPGYHLFFWLKCTLRGQWQTVKTVFYCYFAGKVHRNCTANGWSDLLVPHEDACGYTFNETLHFLGEVGGNWHAYSMRSITMKHQSTTFCIVKIAWYYDYRCKSKKSTQKMTCSSITGQI